MLNNFLADMGDTPLVFPEDVLAGPPPARAPAAIEEVLAEANASDDDCDEEED